MAVAATGEPYNTVIWDDVPGEDDATYNVYASTLPITDITAPNVDVIAKNKLPGAAVVHYLFHPLQDTQIGHYYAVTCVDGSIMWELQESHQLQQ